MPDPNRYGTAVMIEQGKHSVRKGWECPRCNVVNSPDVEKCECQKNESVAQDTKQLLTE